MRCWLKAAAIGMLVNVLIFGVAWGLVEVSKWAGRGRQPFGWSLVK